jgi:acylphosphatase
MKTEKFSISGMVQGVGFRQYVYTYSKKNGLKGFVKNLSDGTVECVASGPDMEMDRLYNALKKGPTMSRVDIITRAPVESEDTYTDFEIHY